MRFCLIAPSRANVQEGVRAWFRISVPRATVQDLNSAMGGRSSRHAASLVAQRPLKPLLVVHIQAAQRFELLPQGGPNFTRPHPPQKGVHYLTPLLLPLHLVLRGRGRGRRGAEGQSTLFQCDLDRHWKSVLASLQKAELIAAERRRRWRPPWSALLDATSPPAPPCSTSRFVGGRLRSRVEED